MRRVKYLHWKKIYVCMITLMAVIMVMAAVPLDFFTYGFFCDDEISNDIMFSHTDGYVDLGEDEYVCTFSPQMKHFAGLKINLANQPDGNEGILNIKIENSEGRLVDEADIDLSAVSEDQWYKVQFRAALKQNIVYKLIFSAAECKTTPYLKVVEKEYVPDETCSGSIAVGYAYAYSVFSFNEKILICLFIAAAWLFLFSLCMEENRFFNRLKKVSVFLFLITLLTWNYMYNSMDNQNAAFVDFQKDSENLAAGPIAAEYNGVWDSDGYGLGWYTDINGTYCYDDSVCLTDENWTEGYSNVLPAVAVKTNDYVMQAAIKGNYILFANGKKIQITNIDAAAEYTNIYLDTDHILTAEEYGEISQIKFFDSQGCELDKGIFTQYTSQYGLQGKIFRYIARYLDFDSAVRGFHLLCSFASAFVFLVIIFMVYRKYNLLFAGCFFITFWLSPWIVNFARNLYWVEFTWFLPMAAGLLCAWKIDDRRCRMACCIAVFLFVLVKSLCGYEYISAVMSGAVVFLISDFIKALIEKDKRKKILFQTILFVSIAAMAGFVTAICIHAQIRGHGNILEGIQDIYRNDVLRRTQGADLNHFADLSVEASLTASAWQVLCQYFHFHTQIITGINGSLFPLLSIIPVIIFGYEFMNRKINLELVGIYVVFLLAPVSWYVLAKAHSYIHIHMNYVLWYFGFVQTCFYIVINKVLELLRKTHNS